MVVEWRAEETNLESEQIDVSYGSRGRGQVP
jgi:hypothetical protein